MKENFVDRLFKFLDEHGGVREVAEVIEVSPQTFYTMKRRGSMPNLSMIFALKEKYQSLDLNWLVTGKKEEKANQEVSELRDKLRRSEAIIDTFNALSKKHKGAITCPGADRKFRRDASKQVMKLAHRKHSLVKVKAVPGRVHGFTMAALTSGYGVGVRLQ